MVINHNYDYYYNRSIDATSVNTQAQTNSGLSQGLADCCVANVTSKLPKIPPSTNLFNVIFFLVGKTNVQNRFHRLSETCSPNAIPYFRKYSNFHGQAAKMVTSTL